MTDPGEWPSLEQVPERARAQREMVRALAWDFLAHVVRAEELEGR